MFPRHQISLNEDDAFVTPPICPLTRQEEPNRCNNEVTKKASSSDVARDKGKW